MADPGQRCTHPWLRVTCGVCGEGVDALGDTLSAPVSGDDTSARLADRGGGREHSQATFIVARGHPELIDQLRALMGHESGVEIIEDRRQRSREEATPEEVRELRRRLREDGEGG